ncbi:GGDEF domain-containing protein [Couchioplanes caeruleus]|uniref:GGDEF domain-containing protein n=1 Tax=Couchioplanes caeruleus TaxID=56438 RepID=UPI0020BD61DE|nr:GGDEF domain-containing protein [Couchioplanes caeruleus]UQU61431.1 GGDEF domain-containing protein [Couchioplanes caeruleus]
MTRAFWWYLGGTGSLAVAHPLLPAGARPLNMLLVSACSVPALLTLLRRLGAREGLPWWILAGAMTVMSTGNALTAFAGPDRRMSAELLVTVGHAALLAAAIALVVRRGRGDIGGLLDVSLAAVTLGGLLWTGLVFPRLNELGASTGEQAALLVTILVLAGVLGALVRVRKVADRRLPALNLLVWALLLGLVGNVVLAVTTGTMTTSRPGWIEVFLVIAYVCVGAAPLHPSMLDLLHPGPAPVDRLTPGRLAFLGLALAVNPLVAGVREILALPSDGLLLALGCVFIVPLVMVRIGRLAAERHQAEAALRHQATHDPLTGLPNRAELNARLEAAVARERATGRPAVVLLFCDLNGFKAVNDQLGHAAGDQVLIGIGRRIRAGLRAGETLARYGGDEFLLLCEEEAQQEAAARLTAHIEQVLAEPFDLGGHPVRAGASVGAVLSDGRLRPEELVTRADQAMYRVKQRHHATA